MSLNDFAQSVRNFSVQWGFYIRAIASLSLLFPAMWFITSAALTVDAACAVIIAFKNIASSKSIVNSHWLFLAKHIAICAFICTGNLPMACALLVGSLGQLLVANIDFLINKDFRKHLPTSLMILAYHITMAIALVLTAPAFALGTGLWVTGSVAIAQPIASYFLEYLGSVLIKPQNPRKGSGFDETITPGAQASPPNNSNVGSTNSQTKGTLLFSDTTFTSENEASSKQQRPNN